MLLLLSAIGMPVAAGAQAPLFRHYTVADGLASSTVYDMMQDSKGYIWLCTEAGINRFDGRQFETFTVADGLADNENFKCYEDSKGRIWFSSYNGRLCYFRDHRFINEHTDSTLRHNIDQGKYIKSMLEDKNGDIWFSTFYGGIFKYDGHRVTQAGHDFSSLYNPVLFYYQGAMHTLEVNTKIHLYNLTTDSSRIIASVPKEIRFSPEENKKKDTGIRGFVSNAGIEFLQADSLRLLLSNDALRCRITSFCTIGNDLWVGTHKDGLLYIPGYKTGGFTGNYKRFLDRSSISAIIQDHEGGIWISTLSDGIYFLPGVQSYTSHISGLSPVTSISHHDHTGLWAAGTYYGEVLIYNNDSFIRKYRNPAFPETRVRSLSWRQNDLLLVGMDYGPYFFNIRTNQAIHAPFNQLTGTADLYENNAGLWVCGRSSVHLFNQKNVFTTLYMEKNQYAMNDKFVGIATDSLRTAWVATARRLYKLIPGQDTILQVAGPDLFKTNLIDLEYIDGKLWVATHGNGIFILKDGQPVYHINTSNNLTSDVCQRLSYDGKDQIWVATNKGISVYNAHSFKFLFKLTVNDVLINNDVKDIDLHHGKAYIGTSSGISVVDINKIISTNEPPPVYVKYLSANNKLYSGGETPVFKYFSGVTTLSFTAITFQANSSLHYRYLISGKDRKWNETTSGQVELYDLAPGTYHFLIAARKYNSAWSAPVSYTFTITPLWYQSLWFKCLAGLLLGISIYLIYLYQVTRIRKREQEKTLYHKRITELESNALANQMNPHFIFNSLNTVQQFILLKDEEEGLNYLHDFSVLIRQILKYSKDPYISIEDELSFLKRYMELEQIRFSNRFSFHFQVADEVLEDGIKIPPMLIQPLLENSVKHGISASGGHISMIMSLNNNMLTVIIEDDGPGINTVRAHALQKEKDFESTALKVIESRIRLLSDEQGQPGTLTITDKQETLLKTSGTQVILTIPVKL